MRKSFFLAVAIAATLSASATVRDTRTLSGFQKAGAEHTILRPQNILMPKGQINRAPQRITTEVDADHQIVTSNWKIMEHENGSDWLISQTFQEVNNWWYSGCDIKVCNDKFEEQATIHFDVPEGEHCNYIQPFGKITTKFFDIKEATWEMMIYVHCTTADYQGKNYIFVVNNNGEVVAQYDGYAAMWQEVGVSYNKQTRLLIGREDKTTNQMVVDVYKKAGWSGGPSVIHTFTVDTDLTNYSSGSAVNCFSIDDEAFYTVNHYEQSYADGKDENWMPTVRANNNYVVEIYDAEFNLYKTVKSPVETSDKGYCMQTFGYFSNEDLNRDYNRDGSKKLDVVISHENYFTDSSDDNYLYGWTIFDEDNKKLNKFAGRAVDWWPLNAIKGQEDQMAMYTTDEEGNGYIEVYELPSCDFVNAFDDTIEGLPITTNFNRAAVPGGYDYVISISQGFYDENKNILGVVGWFTPEGKLDKRVNFNLGPDAQYFSCALGDMMLNPYLFDTDEGMEYIYTKKVTRTGDANSLDNIVVIADADGKTIRSFAPDATYGSLGNCDILMDSEGNPNLMISFYNEDSYVYEINKYALPFTKWPGGGTGSEADPYVITSVGDLMMVKENLAANYVVANDLDFCQLGAGWTPVQHFRGTLDGQGHSFKNFYLTSDEYAAGLFGYIEGGKVKNITFERPVLNPGMHCSYAGVVGAYTSNYSEFSKITLINPQFISDSFKGTAGLISGLAGSYSTAQECYVVGANINVPEASNVGGIFGDARASGIAKACMVQGSITGKSSVGGIMGVTLAGSYPVNCHVNVAMTAENNVGALVGESRKRGTIEMNYAEGTVVATAAGEDAKLGAGGVVGYVEPKWDAESNAMAARYNISAVIVEGAGEKTSAHRIAGYTVNDYDWTAEDIRRGENFSEGGLSNNFSSAPVVKGMNTSASSADGVSISASDINEAYAAANANFAFGNTVDAPWVYSNGNLHLFFESTMTGIENCEMNGATGSRTYGEGIFDLQGRQYNAIARPGLYVINGKKVIIK